jgi:hypothetical protein
MSFAPGGYSVQIAGKGSGSGVALAEVYDVETGPKPAGSIRLVNMSARTQVGAGAELLIAGFVIRGSTSKTLLIRGVGPALARFGVDQLLRNPELKLFRGPTQVGSNDSWRSGDPALFNLFNSVGAFPIETDDAAILITLAPGSYTVQVSGHDQGTGVALVELYEVQ